MGLSESGRGQKYMHMLVSGRSSLCFYAFGVFLFSSVSWYFVENAWDVHVA